MEKVHGRFIMITRNPVWIYQGYFTPQEVNQFHAIASKYDLEESMIGQGNEDPDDRTHHRLGNKDSNIRQSKNVWLAPEMIPEELERKLVDGINLANQEAGWNLHWDWQERHQYTTYEHRPDAPVTGDFYTWHLDSGDKPQSEGGRIRKLSSTVQLSDPEDYEGGHFDYIEYQGIFDKLDIYDTRIDIGNFKKSIPFSAKTKGTLIVFPSDTYHQVTPVTRGVRKSLVSWFHGNPYV